MATTAGRNWNQIVIWGVAVIVILGLLAWWGGVFQQEAGMTGQPVPEATTTTPPASTTTPPATEAPAQPAPATQPPAAGQPAQPTQSQ